ncbi:unknown [Bacteroides sp. CAG:1060]|nr:unknown [Bacteroides sp. CAG:1060]
MALDKSSHLIIAHRLTEFHVHLLVLFEEVHGLLHTFANDVDNRLGRIELWLLLKIPYTVARTPHHLSPVLSLNTSDNFHKGGLSGAVESYYAYLGTIEKRQIYVFEYYFIVVRKGLPHSVH